eukprot:TRINITY_DN549_c0_g1_i4.p1 TRINITY_DN549_c0_g1~~TRINITY_DN549_c0_g1_i4.p1  ORF type:complete len:240 (-),score=29.92 TRINITY_DN549_c0_g1_i4:180-899(-)
MFILEYAGPLVVYPLLYSLNKNPTLTQKVACGMVVAHFLKRELESIFVHIFSKGSIGLWLSFRNYIHYWMILGLGVGIENNLYFKDPGYSKNFIYVLIGLFGVFEFLNLMCHITLRKLRTRRGEQYSELKENNKADTTPENKKRGIPYGWGFDLVSCANYFWEVMIWLTFAVLSRSYSSYAFLFVASGIMAKWAKEKHTKYLKEFDGKEGRPKYPSGRKAIFPYLFQDGETTILLEYPH